MNIGGLNKQITILSWVSSQSTVYGNMVSTYATLATGVWAQVEPLSGREYYQGQQNVAKVDTRFTIRYSTVVKAMQPNSRIVYNSATYEVKSIINPNDANREIVIMTEKMAT